MAQSLTFEISIMQVTFATILQQLAFSLPAINMWTFG
jgi:hypothetical protein